MLLAIKLAYRNLIGAGLRTWLNVIVLSFSFLAIIWVKGLMMGWDHQAKTDMTNWEIGGGQYWQKNYDPFDPFTFKDSHAPIPAQVQSEIKSGKMLPILLAQGSIYPQGRMQNIQIKGIPAQQKLLKIPSNKLITTHAQIPAIIGSGMAAANKLKLGDVVTMQWRAANGSFDAGEIVIVDIFACNVPTVDKGQVWIDLQTLQTLMNLPNEASILTFKDEEKARHALNDWTLKTKTELTKTVDDMIATKSKGQSVFYIILMLLAMLAIFDTQVLSIFRRQKEIGTYVALGYTKQQVVGLFTVEGAMYSVLAALLSAVYGIPFLIWQEHAGITLPIDASSYGMAMAQTMYPIYSLSLIVSTTIIVVITTTIVSYWPAKKIAKMNPTDALRGKIQ